MQVGHCPVFGMGQQGFDVDRQLVGDPISVQFPWHAWCSVKADEPNVVGTSECHSVVGVAATPHE